MRNQDVVYKICKEHCPARTEQLEIIGLQSGISGGSTGRYLRWLAEENKIEGERKKGDATKTWTIKPESYSESCRFRGQDIRRPLSMSTIKASRRQLDLILK